MNWSSLLPVLKPNTQQETTKSYPIICHNNLDCYVDVRNIPKTAKDRFPLWEFRWGSQEFVPAGHTMGMFWWSAVDKQ